MIGRTVFVGAAATTLLLACTLTRNLDYLSDGKDGGTSTSSSSSSTSSSSSSSSSGQPTGPTVGTPIATAQYDPSNLVQDATNIYWTTDDNRVMKLAKAAPASTAPTQLAKLDGAVEQILQAVIDTPDSGNVYLLLETGEVKVLPKAGGTPATFTTITAPAEAEAIAADDTNVWILTSSDPNDVDQSQVFKYPKTVPATGTLMTTAGASGTAPTTMLLTSDSVFWAAQDDTSTDFVMYQLAKTASPGAMTVEYQNSLSDQGTAIGIAPTEPFEMVIDGQTFFWIDDNEDTAYFQSFAPVKGKATKLFAPSNATSDSIFAIVEDGTNVYLTLVTSGDSSTLLKVPKGGGQAPTTINLAGVNPNELISDGQTLYIAYDGPGENSTNGGILKLAK